VGQRPPRRCDAQRAVITLKNEVFGKQQLQGSSCRLMGRMGDGVDHSARAD
jgi:hypothetical protein